MAKLTKRFVESLEPDALKDYVVWDAELSECAIRVWPSGRKVYFVRYRTKEGIKRYKTLGQHGKLTAEQARTTAFQYFSRVQQGDDPVAEETTFRRAPTVADLAARYMEQHARVKKKPGSICPDEYNLRCHVLPALGTKKVTAVTRADIAHLHHAMRAPPGAANRVLALLWCDHCGSHA
jgi:hypothetical protein